MIKMRICPSLPQSIPETYAYGPSIIVNSVLFNFKHFLVWMKNI